MNNFQTQPLKIYIQDLFRAIQTTENKYIYELFGLTFKNVMIHGVITSVYNTTVKTTNLEISDPTGTIQVYYDSTKSNSSIKDDMLANLNHQFTAASRFGDVNIGIMATLMDRIKKKKLNFSEGDFLNVVGDIFVDDKNVRMISAFDVTVTSIERDIVWLEELRYLYEKFYIK